MNRGLGKKSSKRLKPSNKWSSRRNLSPSLVQGNDMSHIHEELEKIEKFVKEGKHQHEEIQDYINNQIQRSVEKAKDFQEFQKDVFEVTTVDFTIKNEGKKKLAEIPQNRRIKVKTDGMEEEVDSLDKVSRCGQSKKITVRNSVEYNSRNTIHDKENLLSSKDFSFKKNTKQSQDQISSKLLVYQSLDPRKLDLGGIRENCDSASEEERVLNVAMYNSQENRPSACFKKREHQTPILQFQVEKSAGNEIIKIRRSCSEFSSSSSNHPEDIGTEKSEFGSQSSRALLVPLVLDAKSYKLPSKIIEEEATFMSQRVTKPNSKIRIEEGEVREPEYDNNLTLNLDQNQRAAHSSQEDETTEKVLDEQEYFTNRDFTHDESSMLYSNLDFVKKNESFFDKKMRRIEDDYKDLMSELKQQYAFEVKELKSKVRKNKRKEAHFKKQLEDLKSKNEALKLQQDNSDKKFKTVEEENKILKSENEGLKKEIENLRKTVTRLRKKKSKNKSDSPKISYQSPITTNGTNSRKSKSKSGDSFNISDKNLRQMLQNELFLQEKDSKKVLKFSATQKTKPKGQDPRMIEPKDQIKPQYRIEIDLEEHEFYSNEYYQSYLAEVEDRKKQPSKRIKQDGISFKLYKNGWKCIMYKDKTRQEVSPYPKPILDIA